MPRQGQCPMQAALGPTRHQSSDPATIRGSETMGPVAYFSLCLLGCLIFNPSLEASPRGERSLRTGSGKEATACRHGWNHYGDHCFRFFPQKVAWSAAEMKCQQHQPGAHLASILGEAERDAVANYLSESTSGEGAIWIGLHNPSKDNDWVWTDGSIYRYKTWNPGEPNNMGGNEYCVEVLALTGYKRWNDIRCDMKRPYLCKYRF